MCDFDVYGLEGFALEFMIEQRNKHFYELEDYFEGIAAFFAGEVRFPERLFEGSDSQLAFSNGWGLAEKFFLLGKIS